MVRGGGSDSLFGTWGVTQGCAARPSSIPDSAQHLSIEPSDQGASLLDGEPVRQVEMSPQLR